jgi:hypothetical protein
MRELVFGATLLVPFKHGSTMVLIVIIIITFSIATLFMVVMVRSIDRNNHHRFQHCGMIYGNNG